MFPTELSFSEILAILNRFGNADDLVYHEKELIEKLQKLLKNQD